jgi:hypothetical protein
MGHDEALLVLGEGVLDVLVAAVVECADVGKECAKAIALMVEEESDLRVVDLSLMTGRDFDAAGGILFPVAALDPMIAHKALETRVADLSLEGVLPADDDERTLGLQRIECLGDELDDFFPVGLQELLGSGSCPILHQDLVQASQDHILFRQRHPTGEPLGLSQTDIGSDRLRVVLKGRGNPIDRLAHMKTADYLPDIQRQDPFESHDSPS